MSKQEVHNEKSEVDQETDGSLQERSKKIEDGFIGVQQNLKQVSMQEGGEEQDEEQGEEIDTSFALLDYRLVHNSLLDIRSCRTHIFMGTLGIIGAVAVAILSILGATAKPIKDPTPALSIVGTTNNPTEEQMSAFNPAGATNRPIKEPTSVSSSWETWLLWASLVPMGLLAVAIMSTIHKTQSLAKRLSYLEVLGEYLKKKKELRIPHWSGWKKAVHVLERCTEYYSDTGGHKDCTLANNIRKEKAKKQTESSSNEKDEVNTDKEAQTEVDENARWYKKFQQCFIRIWISILGKKKKAPLCSKFSKDKAIDYMNENRIHLLPNILHSFASLSTYIYIIALFIASGGLLSSLAAVIKECEGFEVSHYLVAVLIGLTVGMILTGVHLKMRKKKAWRKLNTFLTVSAVFSSGLTLVLFISIHIAHFTDNNIKHWPAVSGYVLGATIAWVVVYAAYRFYHKLETLRRGKYSFERQRLQWAVMFKYCPLMNENTNVSF